MVPGRRERRGAPATDRAGAACYPERSQALPVLRHRDGVLSGSVELARGGAPALRAREAEVSQARRAHGSVHDAAPRRRRWQPACRGSERSWLARVPAAALLAVAEPDGAGAGRYALERRL